MCIVGPPEIWDSPFPPSGDWHFPAQQKADEPLGEFFISPPEYRQAKVKMSSLTVRGAVAFGKWFAARDSRF